LDEKKAWIYIMYHTYRHMHTVYVHCCCC